MNAAASEGGANDGAANDATNNGRTDADGKKLFPPYAEALDALLAEVTQLLGDSIIESAIKPGEALWVRINHKDWRQCAQRLSDTGFNYFGFLSAIDWSDAPEGRYEDTELDAPGTGTDTNIDIETDPDDPDAPAPVVIAESDPEDDAAIAHRVAGGDSRFQMLLQLHSRKHKVGLVIKADLPLDDAPSVESIHDVFEGANWHERETHEMFGINFEGHPNLQPIYLPTEFEGHPLRKDFPLLARQVKPWPGVVDIEDIPEHLQEQLEAEVMADFEASQTEEDSAE